MSEIQEHLARKNKAKVRIKKKKDPHQKELRKKSLKRMSPEARAEAKRKGEAALQLRMAGVSYSEIAKTVGYAHPAGAKNAIDRILYQTEREASKEIVALDLARLDEFQMRCMHALRNNGDLHQIDRILRIMEFRYRLLGVNDETVRALQSEHGIHITNNKVHVQQIMAAPETEEEFIRKMMLAVGADPDSKEAKQLLNHHAQQVHALPTAGDSENSSRSTRTGDDLDEHEIVDAEIVEDEELEEVKGRVRALLNEKSKGPAK